MRTTSPPAAPTRSTGVWRRRTFRRWPSGSPASACSVSSSPPSTRVSSPATSRSSTPSPRRRSGRGPACSSRSTRPSPPGSRRWRRARSRRAGSSARFTISSGSLRGVIRISGDWPCTSSGPTDYHPLRRDAVPRGRSDRSRASRSRFRRVEGEGLFEITVGPVHAGIIEPGHFRFSVEGETIVNLETRLGFVHKGTEKLFETLPLRRGRPALAERDLGRHQRRPRPRLLPGARGARRRRRAARGAAGARVILLELERLYNHVGDVGMIVNDTGFAFGHAHCFRLREELLRLNERAGGPSPPARRDRPRRRRRSDRDRADLGETAAIVERARPRLRRDREPVARQHDRARAAARNRASDARRRRRNAGGRSGGRRQRNRRGCPARWPFAALRRADVRVASTRPVTCGRARWCASTRCARRRA